MAPAYQELTTPYTVVRMNEDDEIEATLEEQTNIKLSPSFSPIRLNAGIGGRFDVSSGSWFKLSARLGGAYRHVFTRNLFVIADTDTQNHIITLNEVGNTAQLGLEAALNFEITPVQWFTLKTDFSLLEPFNDWDAPVIDLDLDAVFRLSSIASLSYTLRLNYDVNLIDKVHLDQYIQLRFSYKVL